MGVIMNGLPLKRMIVTVRVMTSFKSRKVENDKLVGPVKEKIDFVKQIMDFSEVVRVKQWPEDDKCSMIQLRGRDEWIVITLPIAAVELLLKQFNHGAWNLEFNSDSLAEYVYRPEDVEVICNKINKLFYEE